MHGPKRGCRKQYDVARRFDDDVADAKMGSPADPSCSARSC